MNISGDLQQSVTRKAQVSLNADGDPTMGAAELLNARVELTVARVRRGKDGVIVSSTASVWLDVAAKETDRFWLPGDDSADASKGRVPIAVEGLPDLDGRVEFWRVYL